MQIKINGKQVLDSLEAAGIHIPHDSKLLFHVPSGGDYSNATLEIDDETPLIVRWGKSDEAANRCPATKIAIGNRFSVEGLPGTYQRVKELQSMGNQFCYAVNEQTHSLVTFTADDYVLLLDH